MDRLDKTVAKQMNLSRSGARQLIRSGAVELNDKKIFAADEQIDINSDELKIGGKTVTVRRYLYIMLNKPFRNSPSSIVEICATAGYNEKDNVCQWGTPDYEIWKTVAKKQLRIVASYGAAVSYKFAIEAGMYN